MEIVKHRGIYDNKGPDKTRRTILPERVGTLVS